VRSTSSFFCLEDPRRLAIDMQEVVREAVAGFQRKLSNSYTSPGADVGGFGVLHHPSSEHQRSVDVLAGELLGWATLPQMTVATVAETEPRTG
jgi:hypothetical protein